MPFDVIGWSEATPGAGTVNIAGGLLDTLYTVVGDQIFLKSGITELLALMYAAESTPAESRIVQPHITAPALQFLKCDDLNDADPMSSLTNLSFRPIQLAVGRTEAISVNATDEDTLIAAWIGTGKIPFALLEMPSYPRFRIHGVADQTIVANTWTQCTLTWDQNLPAGKYVPVGMRVGAYVSTGYMQGVARLLVGTRAWRPGVPICQAEGDKVQVMSCADYFTFPWLWPFMNELEFPYDQMPNIEALSPAALTDWVVELDLLQTADWTKGR